MPASYNPKIDLHAIQATAKADLIAARLLWQLGLVAQSIWMLQQSAEKYLKCLWALNKSFTSEKNLQNRLKRLDHDIKRIFDSLDLKYKQQINFPMWIISLDALRYNATFGYSYSKLRSGERFINEIRRLLNERIQKSHLEEWRNTSMRMSYNYKTEQKAINAVSSVLSITNRETKREKRNQKLRWAKIIRGLIQP